MVGSRSFGGSNGAALAPVAIGLCLTLIHMVSIPVTNTSVNPARSTGPAVLVGSWAVAQLWAFWVAPLVGAVVAGIIYPLVAQEGASEKESAPNPIGEPVARFALTY